MQTTAGTSRHLALALAMVFVIAGQIVAAQPAWHTITGPERSFTADVPDAPKYTPIEMRTGAGAIYTMHQYLLDQANIAYVVQSGVYPPEVNVANPRTNLQGGLDNLAKNLDGGKWAGVEWVTHQGLTAVTAVGVRSGSAVRTFSVLKGRQIVTLMYAGPAGTARSVDVERFVGSLRIGE